MSRRTWIVLVIVVAVLAVAPHLPQWWPALVGAVRDFDPAAAERSMLAVGERAMLLLNQGIAFTRARPQLMLGAGAGVALATLILGVRGLLGRRSSAPLRGTPAITVIPSEPPRAVAPLPTPLSAPMTHRQERVLAPTTLRASEPVRAIARRRTASGRGTMVRRLSVAGHSTAEIARATHVGQDAVRLVLLRQAPS